MFTNQLNLFLQALTLAVLVVATFLVLEQRSIQQPRLSAIEATTQSHSKRLDELESRQTNALVYLETKVNNVDAKLDAATSELHQSLKMLELRSR
ncbi:hypothetical protein [Zestomonas thermotolerans]|uniref:hypothetical protein n=1 Tax=Zestomonas thermotolerans TaxID=157784 RepID=UPI000488B226|nr:hypothetical protein [Pseudomonas thermotolerans]